LPMRRYQIGWCVGRAVLDQSPAEGVPFRLLAPRRAA
jgi:hypothetical protein